MRVNLTKGISKTALTNAVEACESAKDSITSMTALTGVAGTEVIWNETESTLTVPKGDTGATGATGATGEASDHTGLTNIGTNTHTQIDTHMTNSAQKNEANVFTAGQSGNRDVIASGATLNIDMSASNRFEAILTSNATIATPTNMVENQGGIIYLVQDTTGSRTIMWNSIFKFMNTDESLGTANDVQIYSYEVYSATKIIVTYIGVI